MGMANGTSINSINSIYLGGFEPPGSINMGASMMQGSVMKRSFNNNGPQKKLSFADKLKNAYDQ